MDLALCHICVIMATVLHVVNSNDCKILDGYWYNELGSELLLIHTKQGMLHGEYRTAVERETGAAGNSHSLVIGAAPYKSYSSTFGFAVIWKDGASITTWTGQCQPCHNGEAILETSWILRSTVDTCEDKWKSTMIGQSTFTRKSATNGPRRNMGTHTPSRNSRDAVDKGPVYGPALTHKKFIKTPSVCTLDGYWYNDLGSEILLQHHNDGTITGEYRTSVERQKGAAGISHSKVYGIANKNDVNSTLAMFVIWNDGASVTGWVGQCHVCGVNGTETIETTWLLRKQVHSCYDNWKSTLHGEDSFTRTEQEPGPRKRFNTHSPSDFDIVDPDMIIADTQNANSWYPWLLTITIVVMVIALTYIVVVNWTHYKKYRGFVHTRLFANEGYERAEDRTAMVLAEQT
ncbi:unnamed protein product [Owenia fusiformis]|uniref:Uncharacterized protein n=1 Tax=Owenia fusiformis TaxID=6347 RepID=A0A8J1TYA0_OWEFU|nr:unnamed protein product [Owenia fusiformis]